jgi:UDP-N-acetylglucosamine--N-acetylmuramyl-(pentapeptide) pyrophosphoryl-undecaprenol N-acetylglucosamine transferase
VGSARGFEAKVVPPKGFSFFTVKSGAVKNQSLLKIATTLFQLLQGLLWAYGFLRKQKPSAVIGVGGYVSVPVVIAAWLARIPIFLQEQNASVGIANRTLGRLAKKVFLGFEEAKHSFPSGRSLFTGNPIRKDFHDPKRSAYDPRANRLTVVGGSQGARAINDVLVELLPELERDFPGIRILHQTGTPDHERIRARYEQLAPGRHQVVPFIEDVASAYGSASLVVGRSGALTVSELIQMGRPSVFVPYPRKGQNDQTANAYLVERAGGARVVEQGSRFTERFREAFQAVYRPETLAKMHESFSALRKGNALVTIADHICLELTP